MARAGELFQYLRKEFYEQNVRRYDGTRKVYKKTLPLRKDWVERQKRTRGPAEKVDHRRTPEPHGTPVIHVISRGLASGGDTRRERRMYTAGQASGIVLSVEAVMGSKRLREGEVISFSKKDMEGIKQPHDDAIVISLKINAHQVKRILVDTGSSTDILYLTTLTTMQYGLADLQTIRTPLVGFTGDTLQAEGRIRMSVNFGTLPRRVTTMVYFLVVDVPSAYNAIIGRTTLNAIGAIVSTPHLKIKFHTNSGVGEERGHQLIARECYQLSLKGKGIAVYQEAKRSKEERKTKQGESRKARLIEEIAKISKGRDAAANHKCTAELPSAVEPAEEVEQISVGLGKTLNIGRTMTGAARDDLIAFLTKNVTARLDNGRHVRDPEGNSRTQAECESACQTSSTEKMNHGQGKAGSCG